MNVTQVGTVTHIELRTRGLHGSFQDALTALEPLGKYGLAGINLQDNNITGTIPRQLHKQLPDLVVINLGNNDGEAAVPEGCWPCCCWPCS